MTSPGHTGRRPRRTWAHAAALVALTLAAALLVACSGSEGSGDGTITAQLPTVATGHMPIVGVQDDRLVNADAVPAERVRMIAATGARLARVDVFWKDIAPDPPADPTDPEDPRYRFARLDAIVRGLRAAGIEPLLAVFNAPAWASGGTTVTPTMPYNSRPPDPAAYGAFMTALATRYSGRSSAGGERLPAVRLWEVWNEPNLSLYLKPEGGAKAWTAAYAGLVRAAYPAVHDHGAHDATVLVGATGPRGKTGPGGVGARDWVAALAANDVAGDAYSQHIYPASAPRDVTPAVPSWATLPQLMEAADGWKPGVPVYITEAGYTTAPTPYRKVAVSEDDQARYVRDIFGLEVVRDRRLKAVVWFNLQDNPNWPAGLLRVDGSEKPSYAVFREVAAGG